VKKQIGFLLLFSFFIIPLQVTANPYNQTELIEKYMDQAIEKYQIPGASLTIIQNEEIMFQKNWGKQSNGKPVTKDTLFTIGSVSKPLTSLAVMKLIEKNKIELDQEINRYIPSFEYNTNGFEKRITIRHLLTHTSGISTYDGLKIADLNLRGTDAITKAVKKLNHVTLNHEPGSVHQYSPANYLLLGSIIESVTGKSFSTFMDDEIYSKLEMNHTVSTYEEASKLGYQSGFKSIFGKPLKSKITYDNSGAPYGYTVSTTENMSKYIQFLLNNNRLLSSGQFDEYTSPQIHRKDEMYYGLGWRISTDKDDPYFFHGGETPDSRAELFISPKRNYGFILLTNKNDFSEAMTTISLREGIKTIIEKETMPEIQEMKYHMQWIPLLLTVFLTAFGIWNMHRLNKKTSFFHYKFLTIVGFLLILLSISLIPAICYLFGSPWHTIYHYAMVTAIFTQSLAWVLGINGAILIFISLKKKKHRIVSYKGV